jgi:hypothetical protein
MLPPPPQSAFVRHSTQDIVVRSQKSAPPRPQSLLFMHPSTQRWAGLHARMFVHCTLVTHSTQALPATSQCWPFGQLASVRQRTQKCVAVSQTLFAPPQSALPVQPPTAHRCVAVSQV